ncbi:MAG: SIMPL domain-containing protein [Candidatus Saccharibacteria bacterium]
MAETNDPNNVHLSINLKWLTIVLVVIIIGMLGVWQPWNGVNRTDQTVSETGTATIKAEPDEFVFNPTYEIKNADKTAALAAVTAKSNDISDGLKKLGVASRDIKNNSSSYGNYYPNKTGEDMTYQVNLTVTVPNAALAQKVQDYLISTAPSGQITPQGVFSEAKKKSLEDKARTDASKEARTKAVKSAAILGFHLGRVKSVVDGAGFGGPMPYMATDMKAGIAESSSMMLQPGENEINYTVTVVYFIR